MQFQRELSFQEFLRQKGTEAKCYRALYRARRVYYQRRRCWHPVTLRSRTLLAGNKLPSRTWLLTAYLLMTTKTDLAALELVRHLGVNWKCTWRFKHKVLLVMAPRDISCRLAGYDAHVGVARNGGEVGRGAPYRQAFVVTAETNADLE